MEGAGREEHGAWTLGGRGTAGVTRAETSLAAVARRKMGGSREPHHEGPRVPSPGVRVLFGRQQGSTKERETRRLSVLKALLTGTQKVGHPGRPRGRGPAAREGDDGGLMEGCVEGDTVDVWRAYGGRRCTGT